MCDSSELNYLSVFVNVIRSNQAQTNTSKKRHMHAQVHACAHACTYAHTRAHTHTHTHTPHRQMRAHRHNIGMHTDTGTGICIH